MPMTEGVHAVDLERVEDPRELLQDLNSNAQPILDGEHPDLGAFRTLAELEACMLTLCLTPIRVGDTEEESFRIWHRNEAGWQVGDKMVGKAPIDLLGGESLTDSQRREIRDLEAAYEADLEILSRRAFAEYKSAAEEYIYRGLQRVPRGTKYERRQREEGDPKDSIAIFSSRNEGMWTYIIDFHSLDFPALEVALYDVHRKANERNLAVRSAIELMRQ